MPVLVHDALRADLPARRSMTRPSRSRTRTRCQSSPTSSRQYARLSHCRPASTASAWKRHRSSTGRDEDRQLRHLGPHACHQPLLSRARGHARHEADQAEAEIWRLSPPDWPTATGRLQAFLNALGRQPDGGSTVIRSSQSPKSAQGHTVPIKCPQTRGRVFENDTCDVHLQRNPTPEPRL